jgi:hypothetical protein
MDSDFLKRRQEAIQRLYGTYAGASTDVSTSEVERADAAAAADRQQMPPPPSTTDEQRTALLHVLLGEPVPDAAARFALWRWTYPTMSTAELCSRVRQAFPPLFCVSGAERLGACCRRYQHTLCLLVRGVLDPGKQHFRRIQVDIDNLIYSDPQSEASDGDSRQIVAQVHWWATNKLEGLQAAYRRMVTRLVADQQYVPTYGSAVPVPVTCDSALWADVFADLRHIVSLADAILPEISAAQRRVAFEAQGGRFLDAVNVVQLRQRLRDPADGAFRAPAVDGRIVGEPVFGQTTFGGGDDAADATTTAAAVPSRRHR